MVALALVYDVQAQLGIEGAPPVEDRGQVGGAVHGRAFGRDHQQRRQLALIVLARYPDDLSALILHKKGLGLQRIGVAFAFPQVEFDA